MIPDRVISGERAGDGTVALRLALFASILSVVTSAAMLVLRTGLPTPIGAVAVGPAILGFATLGPALWANRRIGFREQIWLGPLAVLALLVGCAIAALGLVGHVLLWILFVAALVRTVLVLRGAAGMPGTAPSGRLSLWLLLLLVSILLSVLLLNGTKYLNFIADQLLLYGRTDGDIMFHGAITNAFRYFGFPSTGIDGLHLLRYHTGSDALTALIAAGSGIDAVLALIILQTSILLPLAVFASGWAAATFGAEFLPGLALRPLGLAGASVVTMLLMQNGWFGILSYPNTPMFLGGLLLVLMAPTVTIELIERREQATLAIIAAIIALPLLALTKISAGMIWAALVGWLVLRLVGPKRITFWVTAVVMLALFAGSYWLANDPEQSGAVLFGTPFYVEYGFAAGNYLLPLTVHAVLLAVIAALLLLPKVTGHRALLIETMVAVTAAANLPALVLYIEGGDVIFFLIAMNFLFIPFLTMLIAGFPGSLRDLQPNKRRIVSGLGVLALLGVTVNAALYADNRFYTAISGAALVHTGDLTYYADDKRKVWRADTRRALSEHGLLGLYRLPPPEPTGAGLAAALIAAKQKDGQTAAYIPPESDYWSFVPDCDGRSLWPMAVAGMPLIDGYVPDQTECKQEFSLIGYDAPAGKRVRLPDEELCRRASDSGLTLVLEIDSLADRSKDRVTCR